jgi:hypothetical protein
LRRAGVAIRGRTSAPSSDFSEKKCDFADSGRGAKRFAAAVKKLFVVK